MARRHGWELPAHSLQVVAITVYFLLAIAFYSFLAPFLGADLYEDVAIGVYSLLAISVLILYLRCAAIDPVDPSIFVALDSNPANKLLAGGEEFMKQKTRAKMYKPVRRAGLWGVCCGILVSEDCCRNADPRELRVNEEALYCTLCNVEVRRFSKHCRSCDKCVDGFDHHCQWLNNCVGRKNYVTFLSLMAMSLIWLAAESTAGVAVLVRCITAKKATESQILERLGNGFSLAPFAAVVAVCTGVSMFACIPLGELFFFHVILIRKGITTYEYVIAMRAQSEAPAPSVVQREQPSPPLSPMSSIATGMSGGSSIGLQYRGSWCTPPRVFIDRQDEIVPHLEPGRVPSTVDPDSVDQIDKARSSSKRPIRISAWKLARLDSSEALKAAAKARESSSVLRPIGSFRRSDVDDKSGTLKTSYPPSLTSREDLDAYSQTPSSFSSPGVRLQSFGRGYPLAMARSSVSGGVNDVESVTSDDTEQENIRVAAPALSGGARASVYWDQSLGRFVNSHGQSVFYGYPLHTDSGGWSSSGDVGQSSMQSGWR